LDEFTKRFKNIKEITIAAILTILDQRFTKIYFKNKIACSHAINKISFAINKVALKNRELGHHVEASNVLNNKRTQTINKLIFGLTMRKY